MGLWLSVLFAFLAGLLLGSFLNVCIARLPYGDSVVRPRSHCPSCLHPIAWMDNLPLLSWVVLRARCRHCHQRISIQYPLVELVTGLWFVAVVSLFWVNLVGPVVNGAPPASLATLVITTIALLVLGFLLIGLLVMDWQTHRLPDAFTLTGCLIGFLLACTGAIFLPQGADAIRLHRNVNLNSAGAGRSYGDVFLTGPEHVVFGRLLAIVAAAGLLLLVRWGYKAIRGQQGLGLGDVKLLAMIAAFLGFWPAMLALFVGVIAAIYSVGLLLRGRAGLRSRIPLGTFLSIGGLVAALFGPALIAWYSNLL